MLVSALPLLQSAADVSFWSWSADPGVAFGVTAAAWYYYRRTRARRIAEDGSEPISRARKISFGIGLAVVVLALMSPLGVLADDYSLAAHMLQHVMLTIVAPILLLFGVPAWMYAPVMRWMGGWPWRVWRALTLPVLAFLLFHLPYSVYHVPAAYDLTLRVQPAHIAAHLLFIVAALMAWWPVLAPGRELGQQPPAVAMLYLFVSTIPGQVVGAFITYADHVLYPSYRDAPRVFEMSAMTDQQLGGLIMWIGTSVIYLAGVAIVFFRWASREDREEQKRYARA